jgi:hypothetical protein
MTDKRTSSKASGPELIQKGRALPTAAEVRTREGYAMPAQPASRGPVSERPGSALPPKTAK